MRLDVFQTYLLQVSKKEIIIFGGKQKRLIIHISDLTDVFIHFLKKKKLWYLQMRFENMIF